MPRTTRHTGHSSARGNVVEGEQRVAIFSPDRLTDCPCCQLTVGRGARSALNGEPHARWEAYLCR
jgi:hypothetical protein